MDETRKLDDSGMQGQGQSGSYTSQGQNQGQSGGYAGQSQSGGYTNTGSTPNTQEFKLSGDDIMAKIKELVHEGNVRRITIKNEQGQNILEFPLT
ncbi:MAG TPA: DUF4342 domain-containing protein, partial [Chloroflexia bacterium]